MEHLLQPGFTQSLDLLICCTGDVKRNLCPVSTVVGKKTTSGEVAGYCKKSKSEIFQGRSQAISIVAKELEKLNCFPRFRDAEGGGLTCNASTSE